MHVVNVDLADRGYRILIGAGARRELAPVVRDLRGVARVAVIADQRVADLHLARAIAGVDPVPIVLPFPPGEKSKSLREVERLYDELARARIGRRDLVVTLGGGVAGDLGGFAAATWLRGALRTQQNIAACGFDRATG